MTTNSESRLRAVIAGLAAVHLVGTAGYMWIEGWSLLDSFYMTVITISTVGFSEIHPLTDQGRMFAIMLIVVGVGGMMYGLTVFFQMLVEGQIRGLLGKYKLQRGLKNMRDHYVVCGYGRVGQRVVQDLRQRGELTVVIESEPEKLESLKEHMIPFVPGNATMDDHLRAAGIEHAKVLIVALPNQADSVFVTLSARQMNPSLRIVARCDEDATNHKLHVAGADAVVSPHDMGGEQMALAATEPDVLGYVRIGEQHSARPLRVDQVHVTAGSPMVNLPLGEVPVFAEFDLLLVGISRGEGEMLFKPHASELVREGDTLIVVGAVDQLAILKQIMHQTSGSVAQDAGAPSVPQPS